jgi:hypothetical protein
VNAEVLKLQMTLYIGAFFGAWAGQGVKKAMTAFSCISPYSPFIIIIAYHSALNNLSG